MKVIKILIYIFLNYLIKINLYLIKYKLNKFYTAPMYSFGDIFTSFVQNYKKVINKRRKVLVLSNFEEKIANLFFPKNKIYKTFFHIPLFIPIYGINLKVKNLKKLPRTYKKNITYKEKKILINILKKNLKYVSPKVRKFKNQKYVLVFVKHYNNDINNLNIPFHRQTSNLIKVFDTINFLLKKKIKIIILGNKTDKFLEKVKEFSKNKNIFYFNELSKKEKMIDQLYIHNNCKFSIGTDCGAFIMSVFLKKKIIFFDSILNTEGMNKLKNINFLYKKIKLKNKTTFLTEKNYKNENIINKNSYKIIENSYSDITKQIKKVI